MLHSIGPTHHTHTHESRSLSHSTQYTLCLPTSPPHERIQSPTNPIRPNRIARDLPGPDDGLNKKYPRSSSRHIHYVPFDRAYTHLTSIATSNRIPRGPAPAVALNRDAFDERSRSGARAPIDDARDRGRRRRRRRRGGVWGRRRAWTTTMRVVVMSGIRSLVVVLAGDDARDADG